MRRCYITWCQISWGILPDIPPLSVVFSWTTFSSSNPMVDNVVITRHNCRILLPPSLVISHGRRRRPGLGRILCGRRWLPSWPGAKKAGSSAAPPGWPGLWQVPTLNLARSASAGTMPAPARLPSGAPEGPSEAGQGASPRQRPPPGPRSWHLAPLWRPFGILRLRYSKAFCCFRVFWHRSELSAWKKMTVRKSNYKNSQLMSSTVNIYLFFNPSSNQ